MNLYLSLGEVCSFRLIIQSFSPAQHVAIMSHTFPRLCQPHLCFHQVRFPGSSFISLVCGACHHAVLLHFADFLQGINHRILFFIACPHHGAPHIFRNFVEQKRQFHLHPYLSGHNAGSCLVFNSRHFYLSFQANQHRHYFCLPPLKFFQCLLRPRRSFTSKGEKGVHVIHQALTFYSPRLMSIQKA